MVGPFRLWVIAAVQCMIIAVQGSSISTQDLAAQKQQLAADAWVYGLPAYLIQSTRNSYLRAGVPLNYVQAAPGLSTPTTAAVVRSNADTVYSTAFFDLSQGPVTLHIPSITDRYFVAAMYDAYSNNFASPGTFQNSPAGNYTLYGPADAFRAPPSIFSIVSQTNDVWMIARFYVLNATAGSVDLQKVALLQRQLVVTNTPANITSVMPTFSSTSGASSLGDLALQAYYGLNQAVSDNPYQADPYNQNFSVVGLAIGRSFRPTISTASLAGAQFVANISIAQSIQRPGALQSVGNNWVLPTTIGAYGNNFLARAYTASTGLGALTSDQAICKIPLQLENDVSANTDRSVLQREYVDLGIRLAIFNLFSKRRTAGASRRFLEPDTL